MVQVALVLWGCGQALYPYLDTPDLTVHNAVASRRTLSMFLAALAAGAVILFPSVGCLFRVFKAYTFGERLGGRGTARDRWGGRESDLGSVQAASKPYRPRCVFQSGAPAIAFASIGPSPRPAPGVAAARPR
jgi:hypothetical protein